MCVCLCANPVSFCSTHTSSQKGVWLSVSAGCDFTRPVWSVVIVILYLWWQADEMAWNLPQHPSSYPGGPKRLGERCSLCRSSSGQSTSLTDTSCDYKYSCGRMTAVISDHPCCLSTSLNAHLWLNSCKDKKMISVALPILAIMSHNFRPMQS